MRTHDQRTSIALPATLLQIPNQLSSRLELGPGRLVAIEIADQTNPEPDIVHVIAVDMTAAFLLAPAIANLDLSVASRGPVSNDEMIGQSIPHSSNLAVIIIKNAGTALPSAAVVDNDELPAPSLHGRSANRVNRRAR